MNKKQDNKETNKEKQNKSVDAQELTEKELEGIVGGKQLKSGSPELRFS